MPRGVVPRFRGLATAALERQTAARLALCATDAGSEQPGLGTDRESTLMKTAVYAGFLAALALAAPALAQEAKQDFTLVNKTGYALNEAYLAPADSNEWQEDFLGKNQLDDGDTKRSTSGRRPRPANG